MCVYGHIDEEKQKKGSQESKDKIRGGVRKRKTKSPGLHHGYPWIRCSHGGENA